LLAVVVGLVAATTAGAVPHAAAQQSLIDSDPAVVRARADLEAAQAAAHDAYARLEATQEQQDGVAAKIAEDEAQVAAIEAQREQLAQQRDALEAIVKARAVAVYTAGGNGDDIPALDAGAVNAQQRRQQFGEIAARRDRTAVKQLTATREQLATTADGLRSEQDDLERQRAALAALVDQLSSQQAAVDQRVADANAALERARAIGALHAAGEPVIGPNTLTADQILGWFASKGYRPNLPGTSVAELVPIFLQEAADEGVRGDFAFAQAVLETGGFASAPDNNFSGLGWCDTCARGTKFPTPRDGIRAQVQLLLDYADPGARAADLHHPPSPYWWSSDPDRAARQFDSFFAKGWAPTWSDMGHGNWATDPNYSAKVIGIYRQMVAWAQAH
jgi:peptidoglycan hydrolase CwlO-like protein